MNSPFKFEKGEYIAFEYILEIGHLFVDTLKSLKVILNICNMHNFIHVTGSIFLFYYIHHDLIYIHSHGSRSGRIFIFWHPVPDLHISQGSDPDQHLSPGSDPDLHFSFTSDLDP